MRKMNLNMIFTLMSTVMQTFFFKINLMMYFLVQGRHRQLMSYQRILATSQRTFYLKKIFLKRQRRKCWLKSGRTNTWWKTFLGGSVPKSEWKDNLRMSKESFQQLCKMLYPYLVKQNTNLRSPVSVETQVAIFLYYI